MKLSSYAEDDLDRILQLVKQKIRFIDPIFIRKTDLINAENLTKDIDIDDTEFVALTDHIKRFLWSGDKKLQNGLIKKGWKKFVTTEQLYKIISN